MSEEKAVEVPLPGEPVTKPEKADPKSEKADPLAAHKAAFEKLLASRKAEPSNQIASLPENSEKKEEPVETKAEEDKPKEEESAKSSKKATADGEKLRAKLLLAGTPKRIIDSLSDEEAGEWWKKQEERERTAAASIQRVAELERKLSETASKQSEPVEVPPDELDLEEATERLTAQFGEDEGKALVDVLQSLIAPIQTENKAIKELIETARKRGLDDISKRNRTRLAKQLPALKDNADAWQSIERTVQDTWQKDPQKYSSAEEVFDDVFQRLYGALIPPEPEPAPSKDLAKEKARIEASAVTAPGSQKRERIHSPMDAHRAAFTHLLKNADDVEGAQRAFTRLLPQ